jgi:signal transduction histidine kinase/ligand-binding sensor domain-containing protein
MQAHDGHLWIANGQNLIRFDGMTSVRFNPSNTPGMQVESFVFNALVQDRNGDIWAGTSSSGVVRIHDGKFETIGEREGLYGSRVNRVDLDERGRVWIYTTAGVYRFENGRVVPISLGQEISALLTDPEAIGYDGRLQGFWRRKLSGVELFSHGHWKPFPLPVTNGKPAKLQIRSIYEDRLGRIWFSLVSLQEQYFSLHNGALTRYLGLPSGSYVSYQDSKGFLWLNDHKGRAALWKDGKTARLPDFGSTNLLSVMELPDGGFWVGTIGSALFELRPQHFRLIPTPGAPVFNPVFFRSRNGSIWVGDVRLQRLNKTTLETIGVRDPNVRNGAEFDKQIRAFTEDAKGTLLFAVNYTVEKLSGVLRIPDSRFASLRARMRSLATGLDGTIWIGTAQGLYRYSGNAPAPVVIHQGLPSNQITTLQIDPRGALWVGTSFGAAQFNGSGNNASVLTTFGNHSVRAFTVDSDGAIWIVFAGGSLTRVGADQQVRNFGTSAGLPNEELADVDTDDPGYLWLTYETQLVRVGKRELLNSSANIPVPYQSFNVSDGLPQDIALNGNLRHLRLDDGTLWFSTGAGISSVKPSSSLGYYDHPRATIEEIVVDGVRSGQSTTVRLNANYESLRIAFGSPGVTQPEKVRFRFRLEGYDPAWSIADKERSAFYSHLPAGSYTMEVQATATTSGGWSSDPAKLSIVVIAPWYSRRLTKIALGILCVAGMFSIVFLRRRRQLREASIRRAYIRKLTESQELERKRIAGELHDSLGQQLVVIRSIAMQSHDGDAAKTAQLRAISTQAAEAIHELEGISYSLRPYQLDRLGLTKALDALICLYRDTTPITVLHHVEKVDDCLPQSTQIDLYRIVQEGMNNAIRHSQATEIQVRIWADVDVLQCVIVDNGVGFTRNQLDRVGFGLTGIEERAESAGGSAEILSSAGAGTRISIRIQLNKPND